MKQTLKFLSIFLLAALAGCGKNFLDLKPDQSQKVPDKISDFQALLDHTSLMNLFSSHALGLIGGDEYNLTDARYNSYPSEITFNYMKKAYTWNTEIFSGGEPITDWSKGYTRALQANIALDGLKKITPLAAEQNAYDQAKGSALFYRAFSFYSMAQLFCRAYDQNTAPADAGLPLRLEADVTLKVPRSALSDTYQQIISDLTEAASLLPEMPKVVFRPSKAAVFALLSRLYLQTGDYSKSADYASRALLLKNSLIDFNEANLTSRYVFPVDGSGNTEIIFFCSADNMAPLVPSFIDVDRELLANYAGNDLRKQAYFFNNTDGRILFKGSYSGMPAMFTGLATDEVLLTRAECYARLRQTALAMKDLNQLAVRRYDKKTFSPFTASTADDALFLILKERRKELLFRGTRWEDLRRLNKEPRFAKKLTRTVKGIVYELPANDRRYVWPLPLEAIASGGYPQNPR